MITANIYSKQLEINDSFLKPVVEDELNLKEDSDKKWVRCRNCHNKIALFSDKISINENDSYIFKNPAGIFFRIACFANAPGSIAVSDFTDEHTWFTGYRWSIALCRLCHKHIGWLYSGSDEFYGLIADKLSGV
ncbi:MAG: cereblon family protein [Spirochaetes bacterium]|nr:cereblon family protein [Spirochaetota bacterium]